MATIPVATARDSASFNDRKATCFLPCLGLGNDGPHSDSPSASSAARTANACARCVMRRPTAGLMGAMDPDWPLAGSTFYRATTSVRLITGSRQAKCRA